MAQAEQGGTSWLPEQCLVWLPRGLPPAKPGAKAQVPAPRGGAAWQHFPAKPKPWWGGDPPQFPLGKKEGKGLDTRAGNRWDSMGARKGAKQEAWKCWAEFGDVGTLGGSWGCPQQQEDTHSSWWWWCPAHR